MMDDFTILNAALVSLLQAIELDGQAAFADVRNYPTIQFSGSPAASVSETGNASDYATIVQNFRSYLFDVDLFVSIQEEGNGPAVAFATMRRLAGAVLGSIDNSNTLGGKCEILVPVPSSWDVAETTSGLFLWSRINVTAKKTVVTNNG